MAGETIITLVGNLVDDPELRFTPSGSAVANFRVASTPRTFNKQTNEWEDGDSLFLSCSIWRQAAENVAETLQKGMRVVVQGRLKQRSYDDRDGQKRTVFELEVDEIGPSLKNATAKVTRATRQQGGGNFSGQQQPQQPTGGAWNQQQAAPVMSTATGQPVTHQQQIPAQQGWPTVTQPGQGQHEEPPF